MVTPESRRQRVLEASRTQDPAALKLLITSTRDEDPLIREWAILGILQRRSNDAEALAALVERLREDVRADVRWYAARALGRLGEVTLPVELALKDALADEDSFVRSFAALAVGKLKFDTEPVRSALTNLLYRSPKGSEESHAAGLAFASLDTLTQPKANSHEQMTLFDSAATIDPTNALTAKPKDELLEELRETGTAIAIARNGAAVVVKTGVRISLRYVRSLVEKEKALLERGYTCQICHFTFEKKNGHPYAEVHHIVPVSEGGDDVQDNLLVLCSNHHRQLHFARVEWPQGMAAPRSVVINGTQSRVHWT